MQTITKNNQSIPVSGESLDAALASVIWQSWIDRMDDAFMIKSIDIQSVDIVPKNNRVIFIKAKMKVVYPDGSEHTTVVFLRDNAVAGLCVLVCEHERYVVLVRQPRFPVGSAALCELPAGLIDDGTTPAEVILRELEEEAKLVSMLGISADNVHPLLPNDEALYSSPGIMSERTYPFFVECDITRMQLEQLNNLKAGLADEHEDITVLIVPFADVPKYCSDSKTLAMLYLYEHREL